MGTDYGSFVEEAARCLRPGGWLWVAEVQSRWGRGRAGRGWAGLGGAGRCLSQLRVVLGAHRYTHAWRPQCHSASGWGSWCAKPIAGRNGRGLLGHGCLTKLARSFAPSPLTPRPRRCYPCRPRRFVDEAGHSVLDAFKSAAAALGLELRGEDLKNPYFLTLQFRKRQAAAAGAKGPKGEGKAGKGQQAAGAAGARPRWPPLRACQYKKR